MTAVEQQKEARNIKSSKGNFVPEWKNLKTWINQRCWEEEIKIEETNKNSESNQIKSMLQQRKEDAAKNNQI